MLLLFFPLQGKQKQTMYTYYYMRINIRKIGDHVHTIFELISGDVYGALFKLNI